MKIPNTVIRFTSRAFLVGRDGNLHLGICAQRYRNLWKLLALLVIYSFVCELYAKSPPWQIPSPASKAWIRRDKYGVPHILAETEEEAAFAHGYAVAEDHFALLARLILRARGEQAAVFGERFLPEDRRIRELGIWQVAHDRFEELPPHMQGILEGYAQGYNLYLSKNQRLAPEWAVPVTGIDILAHCRAVLLLDFSLDLRPWGKAFAESGSNMWAIGTERSRSGRGILLANPHLGWSGSNLFHEVQLTVPGRINVTGATLIGFPVVTIGFNENLGWSHTVNIRDSDDVYELTLSDVDSNKYVYEGRLLPLKPRKFTIRVKTDSGIETRTYTSFTSHYGPVIRIKGNKGDAYKSANLSLIQFLTQYNLMAKAKNLTEFRAALNMQELPMFNVAYADNRGNIFYLFNGRIPIRPTGFDWSGRVPGNTSKSEWFAVYPLAELPQVLNPRGGYIQNCNDAPWYANIQQQIERTRFSDYITSNGLGFRGQISLQMIEEDKEINLEEVKSYKHNERLLVADRLKAELIEVAKTRSSKEAEISEAIQVLQNWNNQVTRESRGSVLFLRWWQEYSRIASGVFKIRWTPESPLTTPVGLGDPDQAITALIRAAAAMKKEYGTLSLPWGEVYRLRRGILDVPIGGANVGCLRTISYSRDKDGKWIAVGGDSYVLAVEFTDPPTAFSITAYSQSSNPESSHYADQSSLFAQEGYKPVWFTEQDIQKNLERIYRPGE
jgi:acyl-homoserine-lactone acylase